MTRSSRPSSGPLIAGELTGERERPVGWRRVRLGEVARVVGGSTPVSGVAEYWNGNIVWITPTDLGALRGRDIVTSARRITRLGYESCGTELVPPGAVVLSSRAPIGHLGIAGVELCTNQGCKTFVPSPELDSLFLYFALKASVPELRALGSGATFSEVSKTTLEGFEFDIPSLPEQRRISKILEEQLAAVERARAAAEARFEAASDLMRTLVREAFDRQLGSVEEVPIGELLALRHEVIHPRDSPTGRAVFVGLEHVESDTGRRIGSVMVEKVALTGRKPVFRTGDIVYGYLRPYLNKVWVAEFDGLCSVDQYVFAVNQKRADTNYVSWFLRSPQFLRRAPIDAAPGQLPRIRGDEIASTTIPLPGLREQQAFVERLSDEIRAYDALIQASKSELESVRHLPTALLHGAFCGET